MIEKIIKILVKILPTRKLRNKYLNIVFSKKNNFYITDNDLNIKKKYLCIQGLKLKIQGENNSIYIDTNANFTNSEIELKCNNSTVILGSGNYRYLKILGLHENNYYIKIGNNFNCFGVTIFAHENNSQISIGDNCLFSGCIDIWLTDGHAIIENGKNTAYNTPKPIIIGNHVWLGQHVKLTKGTEISDNSVVGIGSVVSSKFKSTNSIIAGNPARLVKENINWAYCSPSEYNANY